MGVARLQRCEFMTEEDQVVNAGRSTKLNGTPDFLLSRPLSLNGKTVHWVEAKCFCLPGAGNKRQKTLAQGGRYVPRYGTGAMVFYHGFVHSPASADAVPEGVMVLDWDYRPVEADVLLEWPEYYRLELCAELSVRKKKLWADFDGVLSSVEIHAAIRHPSVRAFQVQVIDAMEEELKRRWKQESRRLFRRANKQNKGGKPTRGSTSTQTQQAQGSADTCVTPAGADDHDSDDDDHSEEVSTSPLPPPPSPLQNRSDSLKSSTSSPVLPPTLQALAEHKYASKRELDKRLKDKNEPRLRALRNLVGNVAEDLHDAWKKKHMVDERLFLLECLAVFAKTPRASPSLHKGRSNASMVAAEEQCESVLKEDGVAGVSNAVTELELSAPSSQACMRDEGRWALLNGAGGGGDGHDGGSSEDHGDGGGGGLGKKGCSSCYEDVELAFRVHAVHLAEDLMMNEQHKEGAARVIMQLRHFTAFLALYHQALNGSGDARVKDSPTSSTAGSSIPSTRGRSLSHQDFRSLSRTSSLSSSVSSASPHRGPESRHTSSSPSSSSCTRAHPRDVAAAGGNGGGRGRSLSPPPPRHPPRSSSSSSSSASRGVPRSPPPLAASSSSSALLSLSPPPSTSSSLQPSALLLPFTTAELTLADVDALWRPACEIARHAGIDLQDVISNSAWLMVLDEVKRNGVKCVERVQRRLAKWVVLCTGRVTPRSARKALKTELKGLLRRSTQPQMTYARLTSTACEILKDPRHNSEFQRWSAVETSLTGLSNQDRMAFRAILIKYNSCRELTEAEVKAEVQRRIADKSKFRRCHRLSSSSIAALDVNRGSSSEGDTLPLPLSHTHLRVDTCSCARLPQATPTHMCAVCMGLSSPYTHESLRKPQAAQKGPRVDNFEVEGGGGGVGSAVASTSSIHSSSGGGTLQASARRRRRSVETATMLDDYRSQQGGGHDDAGGYHRGEGGDGGGGGGGKEWVDVSAWTEPAQLSVHEQEWVDKADCEEVDGRQQHVLARLEEAVVTSLVLYMPGSEVAVAAYAVDSADSVTAPGPVASCVQVSDEAYDDAEVEEEDEDDDDDDQDEEDAELPMVEIAAGGACAEPVNEECVEVEDYDFDVVKRGVSLGSEEVLGGAGEDDWDDWKGVADDDGESLCGGIDRRLSSWSSSPG